VDRHIFSLPPTIHPGGTIDGLDSFVFRWREKLGSGLSPECSAVYSFCYLPGLLLVDPLLSSSGLIVFYNLHSPRAFLLP